MNSEGVLFTRMALSRAYTLLTIDVHGVVCSIVEDKVNPRPSTFSCERKYRSVPIGPMMFSLLRK